MKPPEAPLYVRSHDLARWILEHVLGWSLEARSVVGDPLASEARTLVLSVSLALTFIRERAEHAREADRSVVRIREMLRLARDLSLLSASAHRYAQGELLEIGRMVGGWRKRWTLPEEDGFSRAEEETGHGRRRSRDPRWQLQERGEEVPVGLPEQEAPGRQEQEPGLPCPRPSGPEPDGQGSRNKGIPS